MQCTRRYHSVSRERSRLSFARFLTSRPRRRVTGRGYMDINRISGYLPGKIVSYFMQVRPVTAFDCPNP